MTRRLLALLAAGAAACGSTSSTQTASVRLTAPTDVAFACYGALRITGGTRAGTAADPIATTAAPLATCDAYARSAATTDDRDLPLGQENLHAADSLQPTLSVDYYALVLQTEPGTLALAKFAPKLPQAPASSPIACTKAETDCPPRWSCTNDLCVSPDTPKTVSPGDAVLIDLDPLTPGANSVSVGSLPVGVAVDRSGCYAVTANAGTCDLSVIDVSSVAAFDPEPVINRVEVTNAAGEPVAARPSTILAAHGAGTIGVACPAAAEGVLWIAYPDCHLVAAVDAGTGQIKAGVKFAADGTATLTDGAVSCPAQCGGGDDVTDGYQPVALDLADDARVGTRRLAIGGAGASVVTVVDLGADYLPTSVEQIALQGAIDVTDVAISPQIGMGNAELGTLQDDDTPGGQFQFVYAVASDGTVRVADVLDEDTECDTQVDPAAIRGETDVHKLSCFPVGDLTTPARRVGARGPGIELTNRGRPTAVTIVHATPTKTTDVAATPSTLMGYFAIVTATAGDVYIVNVDDDNYPDVEDPASPLAVQMPLALPHQLRDGVSDRAALPERQNSEVETGTEPVCSTSFSVPASSVDVAHGWPHMVLVTDGGFIVQQSIQRSKIAQAKLGILPTTRKVSCTGVDFPDGPTAVNELAFEAPPDIRRASFPDVRAMPFDEVWTATWEGSLSNDPDSTVIDGPRVRSGLTVVDGTGMRVVDGSGPYCAAGVEPYDIVALEGCNPANNNADCDVGHICYVHPDSVSGKGACLPTAQADALASACRDYLITDRVYAATSVKSGELRLTGRRRVLRTTPVSGCTSAQQCSDLELVEAKLPSELQPRSDTTTVTTPHAWACEADPSRAPGINRCVMTCQSEADCSAGSVCEAGRCVEGVVPPLQCALGVQRYQLKASEAFTLLGSRTGYLHGLRAAADGTCERDPAASRLLVGRIPLAPPACTAGADSPNPCRETVSNFERPLVFDSTCTRDSGSFVERQATTIRFSNPLLTFHLVDPTYPGDAQCIGDRGGALVDVPVVFPGYALSFRIQAGFSAKRVPVPVSTALTTNVVRGPGESIWVVDEGDLITSSGSTAGAVVRLETTAMTTTSILR